MGEDPESVRWDRQAAFLTQHVSAREGERVKAAGAGQLYSAGRAAREDSE